MMLCVLLEIVQGLQCTMSLLSYAAPLDDETDFDCKIMGIILGHIF